MSRNQKMSFGKVTLSLRIGVRRVKDPEKVFRKDTLRLRIGLCSVKEPGKEF